MCNQAFVLASLIAVTLAAQNPCDPAHHAELADKERSTAYTAVSAHHALCDNTLQSGWYRFAGNGTDGMMPEHCVPRMQCGTMVPIWLSGTHPTVADGTVSRKACANLHGSTTGTCCDHFLTIAVRNCGGYFVYYLTAPPSCPLAYCAGDRAQCPPGQWSPSGFAPCKESFPVITAYPTLNPPKMAADHRMFYLECDITYAQHDPDLAFEVAWTFDGAMDAAIPVTRVMDPARKAYLDGTLLNGHLGTSIGYRVRARYMRDSGMFSPWIQSNTYWVGIKTDTPRLTIHENGETRNVTLTSTLPLVCDHDLDCCLTFKLDVEGPRDNGVTAHSREHSLCSDAWDAQKNSASLVVPVSATRVQQITAGDTLVQLTFQRLLSGGRGAYLQAFDGYTIPSVLVRATSTDVVVG